MKEHPYMDKIKTEEWDRYKDLSLVWNHESCQDKFNKHNTLLMDSDNKKIQLCLENAIKTEPYTLNDQQLIPEPDEQTGFVRNDEWHENYCDKLCKFVL